MNAKRSLFGISRAVFPNPFRSVEDHVDQLLDRLASRLALLPRISCLPELDERKEEFVWDLPCRVPESFPICRRSRRSAPRSSRLSACPSSTNLLPPRAR